MPTPPTPTTTPAPRTPRGRRGHLTFSQQRLAEPLILEQTVLDPTWNAFKTFMVFLGGILFFLFVGGGMYWLGSQQNTVVQTQTDQYAVPQPQPPIPTMVESTSTTSAEPSAEELDRRHTEYLRSRGQ